MSKYAARIKKKKNPYQRIRKNGTHTSPYAAPKFPFYGISGEVQAEALSFCSFLKNACVIRSKRLHCPSRPACYKGKRRVVLPHHTAGQHSFPDASMLNKQLLMNTGNSIVGRSILKTGRWAPEAPGFFVVGSGYVPFLKPQSLELGDTG